MHQLRMAMRRFTRLTNAFSKKIENHVHMVALYTVWYNFVKQHKSLKGITPAMAAGVTDRLWELADIVALMSSGHLERILNDGEETKRATRH